MSRVDFTEQFREFFGSQKRIAYAVRCADANVYHDVAFVSSLLHDSVFKRSAVTSSERCLFIRLLRDRWEQRESSSEGLPAVNAEFVVREIVRPVWRLTNTVFLESSDASLTIDHLEVWRCRGDLPLRFELGGHDWALQFSVAPEGGISLTDVVT